MTADALAPSQEENTFNPLSLASYLIVPRFDKQELASATGFFVRRFGKLFLVTNGHVVSGREPETGTCVSKTCAIPNNLLVRIHKKSEYVEFADFEVRLFDGNGGRDWLEHPKLGASVDVVAIEVQLPDNLLVSDIDSCIEPMNDDTKEVIADDVFVIGYPFGLTAGDVFPIWKRATVASEPVVDINDLPKMFVDTASRAGMSGSPVVLMSRRPVTLIQTSKHDSNLKEVSRHRMKLIGVYSGRIGADDTSLKAQLGVVWKTRVLNEIIGQLAHET